MAERSPGLAAKLALALGAGLFGATAMLLSQRAEMKATGRAPSLTPARSVETITGLTLYDERDEAWLSTAAHFAFGTTLGLGVALLDGVEPRWRAPLFALGAWCVGNGTMTALGVAPPPTRWTAGELAIDVGHHAVYGVATALAYAEATRLAGRRRAPG